MELTETEIVRLAGYEVSGPVVSCYLDVDGGRHVRPADYRRELDDLLRRARARHAGDGIDGDLDRIEAHVADDIDRSAVRGLALFSRRADDLWEVVELPFPVTSQIVVNPAPAVSQLEAIVSEHEPVAVLLVDKQHVRLFEFALGRLVERNELVDQLPRDYDDRGERERGSVDDHVDALVAQHVRHAADVAFELFKRRPFEHLAVGASAPVRATLEAALHPYLRERLTDEIDLVPTASLDEIRRATVELDERLRRRREQRRVDELRAAVGSDDGGVAGLAPVLDALAERRVDTLLVSRGYGERGWRCEPCSRLAAVGRACPVCAGEMDEVEDVVEEAVDEALAGGVRVEVCTDNADLDVLGRIGARLRY